jgi:formate hydrogenlyase subunit 6/NADH:ubiquinone oxidoreductase subunit I
LYSSHWNPIYRTGTISILLLAIIIVTGLYLLFVYRLSAPYESIVELSKQWWLGGWIRSLHRYASDFAIFFVFIHVIRMFAEKKTFGARTLAWISGVFCLLLLLGIGWTGFVLVWDRQGQELATIGAQLLSVIPLFENVITRSFSGVNNISSSFFFMNLFLHVALPLGMVLALWIHTSRLNQPRWVPEKNYSWYVVGFLILFSLLSPVDIAAKANLFLIRETFYVDLYYNAMILFHHIAGSNYTLLFFLTPFFLLMLIPFVMAPNKKNLKPISQTDQKRCEGCQQCYEDCPFEAIQMVPRTEGIGSINVASVFASKCIGCGICSASCSQLSIGPTAKTASVQLERVRNFKANAKSFDLVICYCSFEHCETELTKKLQNSAYSNFAHYSFFPIECMGELHIATINSLSASFKNVLAISCPTSICQNRSGVQLFKDRIFGARGPKLPRMSDFQNVKHFEIASNESLINLTEKSSLNQKISLILATFILMLAASQLTNIKWGEPINYSVLRTALRLPPQYLEECRDLSREEIEKRPLHMRKTSECIRTPANYNLVLWLDEKDVWHTEVKSPGLNSDKPYVVDYDMEIPSGHHKIKITLDSGLTAETVQNYVYEFESDFAVGNRTVLYYNVNARQLSFKNAE